MFTKIVLVKPKWKGVDGINNSQENLHELICGGNFVSWLRGERRVVYKVTGEQRHRDGEWEGVLQIIWSFPTPPPTKPQEERVGTDTDIADLSRALGAHVVTT